ncbi:MAG: hypothetical protein NW226_02990 [Microscillaceae bacterium]|nr:hypothetical protein [Microscillaceae bacterium]
MKKIIYYCVLVSTLIPACTTLTELQEHAGHYRRYQDYQSLNQVVNLIPLGADVKEVTRLLGKPIDNGFDIRYVLDSIGPNNCTVGAVFHLDENRKVDQKWLDEICE